MRNYTYDWENPAVFKRNKEDGHVIAFSYDNCWIFPIVFVVSHILPPTRLFAF